MIGRSRFARWLDRDDRVKGQFLAEVENGASETVALERIGASAATLREWLREDRDFARAARIARRGELGQPRFYDLAEFLEPGPQRPATARQLRGRDSAPRLEMTRSERATMVRVLGILQGLLDEDPQATAEIATALAADLTTEEQNRRELKPELN